MHPAIIIGIVRSLIVDVAIGQIPRSTERISSCNYKIINYNYNYFPIRADNIVIIVITRQHW